MNKAQEKLKAALSRWVTKRGVDVALRALKSDVEEAMLDEKVRERVGQAYLRLSAYKFLRRACPARSPQSP